jgi:hypothetical protein
MPSEDERVAAVRDILTKLYSLPAGFSRTAISRLERETIFFLYENTDNKLAERRPHSLAARHARENTAARVYKQLTYDHAIPLATLRASLQEAIISHDAMKSWLRRCIKGAVITRDENVTLNKHFRFKMPSDADKHDPMARYRATGIVFSDADERLLLNGDPQP